MRDQKVDFTTCSLSEFSGIFSRSIPKRFDDRHFQHYQLYPAHQQHHFLLKPIDASARLIVNRDVSEFGMPKFEVDVNIPDVAFRLEESQYCDILYLVSKLQAPDHYAKYQHYRKFRPRSGVFDAIPGEWWRYAIKAVTNDVRDKQQRWSWSYMSERRQDRKKYVSLWLQRAKCQLDQDRDPGVFSDSEEELAEHEESATTSNGELLMSPTFDRDSLFSSPYRLAEIEMALEDIEKRRPVEDILFFRYLADLEVAKIVRAGRPRSRLVPPLHHPPTFSDTESVGTDQTGSSGPTEEKYRTWGTWMFGWTSKLTATPSPLGEEGDGPRRVLPDVELRELFKILEFEPSKKKKRTHQNHIGSREDLSDLSDETSQSELGEIFRVTVTLQRGSLTLASDPETNRTLQRDDPNYGRKYSPTDFLLGTFSQLQVAGVARDDTMIFDLSLQSIEAFDESAESSSFSRLLSRKQTFRPGADSDESSVNKLSGVVFLMSFETNPANSKADAALFVHMEPLEIVLSPTARCWGRLSSFLDTPKELGLWAELEVASFNDIVNLKARTEAKLNYVLANRVAVSVDLRIQAPVIIIPESDTDYDCARLVIDLGHINFRTDRLSQLDSDIINFNPASTASLGRSGISSLALTTPNSPGLSASSTSFVKQLYDEADRGEGAIRWKEEFYDKFSLSITNIHVLLVPYGNTSRTTNSGNNNQGAAYPSVSLPAYYYDVYDQEHENELVERFNINVTVRTSILPLDATLTRLFVHADLPALTFNMSVDKYFQLVSLMERFSLAAAMPSADTPQSQVPSADGFMSFMRDQDDISVNPLSGTLNALTSSSLRPFTLDDGDVSISQRGGQAIQLEADGASDGESSVESDDTWFSITSGNVDWNSAAAATATTVDSGVRDGGLLLSDLSVSKDLPDIRSPRTQPMREARKKPHSSTATVSSELTDRRLCVVTITIPLVSVKLKKPRSANFSSYASYSYDPSNAGDDENNESGTILIKLQGFRARVGQKTLSTQLSMSLLSLEVEDNIDEAGRAAQYLLFSCPSIEAPFSMSEPLRRGSKFPTYANPRIRPRKQRERVVSLQRSGNGQQNGYNRAASAPDQLLDFAFSSANDPRTGRETLRNIDVQVGSIQLLFDQSYVCSLLELFADASSQTAIVPATSRELGFPQPVADDELPPLDLTETIRQEYMLPVKLTESVQADLERARQNMIEKKLTSVATAPQAVQPAPTVLTARARIHSVSVCFSDRGDAVTSIALLRSECQLSSAGQDSVSVTGSLGDIKIFDLSFSKKSEEGEMNGYSRNRESPVSYREIFGHAVGVKVDRTSADENDNLVHFDCSVNRLDSNSKGNEREQPAASKSRLNITILPAMLKVQPYFIESVAAFVLDGPLRAHFISKNAKYDVQERRERIDSIMSADGEEFSSPALNADDFSLEASTPFFDAIDSNRGRPSVKRKMESATVTQEHAGVKRLPDAIESPAPKSSVYLLDHFDIELKVIRPCAMLPSFCFSPSDTLAKSDSSDGIELDFGILLARISMKEDNETENKTHIFELSANDIKISSLPQRSLILEPSGFKVQVALSSEGLESHSTDVAIAILPICVNLSDANVCQVLDVYYGSVLPILDIVEEVQAQLEKDRVGRSSTQQSAPETSSDSKDAPHGSLTIHCSLDEFKILLLSTADGHLSFEAWMKQVIYDTADVSSVRESFSGSSFPSIQLESPRRRHFVQDDEDSWPNQGISPFHNDQIPIAQIALTSLSVHLVTNDVTKGDTGLRCDFSLMETSVTDKVADLTVCCRF